MIRVIRNVDYRDSNNLARYSYEQSLTENTRKYSNRDTHVHKHVRPLV